MFYVNNKEIFLYYMCKQNTIKKINMKLLENILLATDFSKPAENIVGTALFWASSFRSKITLIHVLPENIKNEKVVTMLSEAAKKMLAETRGNIKDKGIKTDKPILKFGKNFAKITKSAIKTNANLIIIGSGEKSKNDVFQLGTIADKIVRKSVKPVLVVKNNNPIPVKKIICPIDFSSDSKRALKNAIILALRFRAVLNVVSVYEVAYTGSLKLNIDWQKERERARKEHMEEFNSFVGKINFLGLNWKKEILGGDPAIEIIKAIKRHESDLLIMGTSGKTGLNRLLLGSVTEKVIRKVPCSFITIKSENIIKMKKNSPDIERMYGAMQYIKDSFL